VYLKKPVLINVSEELVLGEPAIVLTGKCYVLDVKYEKAIESDIYTRASLAFQKFPRPKPGVAPHLSADA
jgi:hypothetical protein